MYKRGDIVLVNLNPQRNNEAGKVRPCIVISDSDVNEILDLVTIIPCTTNLLGEGLFRIPLSKRESLDENCEVMIEQIRGVSKKRVLQNLSTINSQEIKKIEMGIKALLTL
ncbi:MAG: type II toxin-antitoxin system PemK/MazF family toxin [Campylobacterota bacterium]